VKRTCEEYGYQFPGDCNQDGTVNISDVICLFGFLFLGSPEALPCGDTARPEPDGSAGPPSMSAQGSSADIALMDWNGDGALDLSDGTSMLMFLFIDNRPENDHAFAPARSCVPIAACPNLCGSQ
jgi:hypothetical protein